MKADRLSLQEKGWKRREDRRDHLHLIGLIHWLHLLDPERTGDRLFLMVNGDISVIVTVLFGQMVVEIVLTRGKFDGKKYTVLTVLSHQI